METDDLWVFGIAFIGLAILSMVLITIQSILGIWALNALFAINVPYRLDTIFAAMVLVFIIQGGAKFNFKK